MKKVLDWVKANVWVVALSAVMIVTLPVTWVFSSGWNKSIRTKQEKAASADLSQLTSNSKVTYTAPPVLPGGAPIELATAPNEAVTSWFRDRLQHYKAQAAEVVELAQKVNAEGHGVLVEGLFPAPAPGDEETKALDMVKAIMPSDDPQTATAYQKLIASINAGAAPDAMELASAIEDLEDVELEKLRSEGGAGLSEEEQAALEERLVSRRRGEYQRRAREISVYGGLEIFPTKANVSPVVPRVEPTKPPKVWECFIWQHDFWVVSDIFEAIRKANLGEDEQLGTVEQSVVKRIQSITIQDLPIFPGDESITYGEQPPPPEPGAPGAAPIDYARSITGRHNSPANQLFDVRRVNLVLVVSSARLPELFNAIRQTNMMEVVGCTLTEVDPYADLREGYFYGSEHSVRAQLEVETIWLRSWTVPLMPEAIKSAMVVVEPPTPEAPPEGEAGEGVETPLPADGGGGGG